MKTTNQNSSLFGLGSCLILVLGLATTTAFAGPGGLLLAQQEKNREEIAQRAKQGASAQPAAMPADANGMACPACKTTTLRDAKSVGGPIGKGGHYEWFDVGQKHTCKHCGGEIRVVKGVVTNTMPGGCPMCGDKAALCVAAMTPAKKT